MPRADETPWTTDVTVILGGLIYAACWFMLARAIAAVDNNIAEI